MTVLWAALIVAAAGAIAAGAMLVVRRRAPDGSYFADGDRAAGVFGVLATGLSVLLGFVIFLAFTSYDESQSGAEDEALAVAQQFETAQFLPLVTGRQLSDDLICYARYVVHQEWPRLQDGTQGNVISPWSVAMFRELERSEPSSPSEEAAFSKWLDQTSDREQARNDRVHAADGVVPAPLWIVLVFAAVVILVFMFFFADRGERALVQGVLIGSVVSVLCAMLLLLWFLDNPYQAGLGGLEPDAMERTLDILEQSRAVVGQKGALPCTELGVPLG